MRGLLTLVLLMLLPTASAQGALPPPSLSVELQPPADVARPGGSAVEMPFVVRVGCEGGRVAGPIDVTYTIVRQPAWATVEVTPSADSASFDACAEGFVAFHGVLTARATPDAPAFMPELIEVEAIARQPFRFESVARGSVPMTAGYVALVDVSAERTLLFVEQGELAAFLLRVTNFGNAHTRVDFEIEGATPGYRVERPLPITLESRHQAGRERIVQEVRVPVERVAQEAGAEQFVVRWFPRYALDPALRGESGMMHLALMPQAGPQELDPSSISDDVEARVPMPPAALVAALGFGLALVRQRR